MKPDHEAHHRDQTWILHRNLPMVATLSEIAPIQLLIEVEALLLISGLLDPSTEKIPFPLPGSISVKLDVGDCIILLQS